VSGRDDLDDQLVAFLEHARQRGYFGPGPIAAHVGHARGFVAVAEQLLCRPPVAVVDLGTGGGVPGLVLAAAWPAAQVTLVEAARRRSADLAAAARALFGDRVVVRAERAEVVAHDHRLREAAELVTARSFGPPALTAEIATGFLAVGGVLIVSEPPGGDGDRWPPEGVAELGFGAPEQHEVGGATYVALPKAQLAPAAAPRPTRPLVKRPAW
jgi:16S rRNA (guanine527-N7)-methyltransferase